MAQPSREIIGVAILAILTSTGCKSPDLEGEAPAFIPIYEVEVAPGALDFASQPVGHTATERFTIFNHGNIEVLVTDFGFPERFDLSATIDDPLIAPGEAADVAVHWDVNKPAILEGKVRVLLGPNMEDQTEETVKLAGSGIGSTLTVSVAEHDFGVLPLGCSDYLDVTISNPGNDYLQVQDVILSGDVEFGLEIEDALPIVVPPFGATAVRITYAATDDQPDSATLSISSNAGHSTTLVRGSGTIEGQESVTIEASHAKPIAVLFFVNECVAPAGEGARFQAVFEAALPSFFEELNESGSPYRVGFTGDPAGTVRGSFIDESYSVDAAVDEAISQAAAADSYGDNDRMYDSLMAAIPANKSWVFDKAWLDRSPYYSEPRLTLIAFNDDADQGTTAAAIAVSTAKAYVDSPDGVVFHGIGGLPTGGFGCAVPGTKFKESVDLTGGTYHDICQPSLESAMRDIIRGTVPPGITNGKFLLPLKGTPLVSSIRITVDGEDLPTGWRFDPSEKAVVIDNTFILPGLSVVMTYSTAQTCGG